MQTSVQPRRPLAWSKPVPLSLLALLITLALLASFNDAVVSDANLTPGVLRQSAFWNSLWPALFRVYAVSLLLAYVQHIRKQGRKALWKPWFVAMLPIFLIAAVNLGLAAVSHLNPVQTWLLLSVSFAVTYFNLGATILAGQRPLDGGYVWRDGYRLFGDGKSLNGSIGGILVAAAIHMSLFGSLANGLLIGTATMIGDLLASLFKRRSGMERGAPVPLLDQLDGLFPFLLLEGRFALVGLTHPASLLLIIATVLIQVSGNIILYRLGNKRVPW